jgi:hypothetical protein
MGVWHIQSFRELQEAGAKKKNPFFVHELSIGFDKQFDDQSGKDRGGAGVATILLLLLLLFIIAVEETTHHDDNRGVDRRRVQCKSVYTQVFPFRKACLTANLCLCLSQIHFPKAARLLADDDHSHSNLQETHK